MSENNKPCPQFPYWGASYPDACCVDGKLQDLDYCAENGRTPLTEDLAENDGLSFENWADWFKDYDLKQPMAIIHFTNFRY